LNFLFPSQLTVSAELTTKGVFEAPLVALRAALASLAADAFDGLAAELNRQPDRPLARLLAADGVNLSAPGAGQRLSQFVQGLLPGGFADLALWAHDPARSLRAMNYVNALWPQLTSLLGGDLLGTLAQRTLPAVLDAGAAAVAAFDLVFDPRLTITAGLQ